MTHKLRPLGLSLVAMLMVASVLASQVSASALTAGASSGKLTATQSGENVWTTTPGTVKCSTIKAEGSYASGTIEKYSMSATYSGCKAFGILSAEVKMNNCIYVFIGNGQSSNTGVLEISCPFNQEITVVTATCVEHFEPQIIVGHVVYDNVPSGVLVTTTFEGLKYTETVGCPNVSETKTTSNGTTTGSSMMEATNTSGTHVSLSSD